MLMREEENNSWKCTFSCLNWGEKIDISGVDAWRNDRLTGKSRQERKELCRQVENWPSVINERQERQMTASVDRRGYYSIQSSNMFANFYLKEWLHRPFTHHFLFLSSVFILWINQHLLARLSFYLEWFSITASTPVPRVSVAHCRSSQCRTCFPHFQSFKFAHAAAN